MPEDGVRGGEGVEGGREVHTARAPARGGELGEGKGWTAGQTKPLLLHFCPSGQTPTLYTRALPSCARLVHSLPPRPPPPPPPPPLESLLNASSSSVLSVRYFSSSLINGTVASLAGSRVVQSKDTSEWVSTSQATPKATLSLADGIQVSMTGDDRWWLADGL